MDRFERTHMKLVAAVMEKMYVKEDGMFSWPEIGEYSRVRDGLWRHKETGKTSTSLVETYAREVGVNIHVATMELAAKLGHFAESCFPQTIPPVVEFANSMPEYFGDLSLCGQIPETCSYDDLTFTCTHIHALTAPDGRVSGFYAFYAVQDEFHLLPFFTTAAESHLGEFPVLRMGRSQAHRRFTRQKEMSDFPQATIIFCRDPVLAAFLEQHTKLIDTEGQIIIVTWHGYEPPDMSGFTGRQVFVIPLADEREFLEAGKSGTELEEYGAIARICTVPIVGRDQSNPGLHTCWDTKNTYCRTQAAFADDKNILKIIFENSLAPQEFMKWLNSSGIKENSKPWVLSTPNKRFPARKVSMPLFDALKLSAMAMDGTITLVRGHSDQARNIFAINLAVGLDLYVDTFLGFAVWPTRRVLYLDTSVRGDGDAWFERITTELPKHSIHMAKLRDIVSGTNDSGGLSLDNPDHIQNLLDIYSTERVKVLCLDSLETLFPTASPQDRLKKFLAFAETWLHATGEPIVCCCNEHFFSNEAVDAFVDNSILVEDPRRAGGSFTEDNRRQFSRFGAAPHIYSKVTIEKFVKGPRLEEKYFCYFWSDTPNTDFPGWRYFSLTERIQEGGEDIILEIDELEKEIDPQEIHDYIFQGISPDK